VTADEHLAIRITSVYCTAVVFKFEISNCMINHCYAQFCSVICCWY